MNYIYYRTVHFRCDGGFFNVIGNQSNVTRATQPERHSEKKDISTSAPSFFLRVEGRPGKPSGVISSTYWKHEFVELIAIIFFMDLMKKISESQLYFLWILWRGSQLDGIGKPGWCITCSIPLAHLNSLSPFKTDASELALTIQTDTPEFTFKNWRTKMMFLSHSIVLGITNFVAFYFDYIYIIL